MNAPTTLGLCDGAFLTPTDIRSVFDKLVRNGMHICPFRERPRFSVECNQTIVSSVVLLFFHCCPATIFRRVWAIIVDSINRVLRARWITHVFIKFFKRITPSIADENAATTIILELGASRASASMKHTCPRPMNFCVGHGVSRCVILLHFFCLASARSSCTPAQALPIRDKLVSAVASPRKECCFVSNFKESYACNSVKHLPGQVIEFWFASATFLDSFGDGGKSSLKLISAATKKPEIVSPAVAFTTATKTGNAIDNLTRMIYSLHNFSMLHESVVKSQRAVHVPA
jgi:hypothetical protein